MGSATFAASYETNTKTGKKSKGLELAATAAATLARCKSAVAQRDSAAKPPDPRLRVEAARDRIKTRYNVVAEQNLEAQPLTGGLASTTKAP